MRMWRNWYMRLDLGSSAERRGGSSPFIRTRLQGKSLGNAWFLWVSPCSVVQTLVHKAPKANPRTPETCNYRST